MPKLALALVTTIVAVEVVSLGLICFVYGQNPYANTVSEAVGKTLVSTMTREPYPLTPHPYLGFLLAPDWEWIFGSHSDVDTPYHKTTPDDFVVAIAGGSVAALVTAERDGLLEALSRCPRLQGKRIVITSLSVPGYKQPQQLIAITYFLALGAQIDFVVDMDGVNDLVWFCHNSKVGFDPSYPFNWPWFNALTLSDPVVGRDPLRLLRYRRAARHVAAFLYDTGLYRLASGQVFWKRVSVLLQSLEAQAMAGTVATQFAPEPPPLGESVPGLAGPIRGKFGSLEGTLRGASDLWERSSRLTFGVLTAQGIPYLHILQPNQYFEGTKPLSALERQKYVVRTSLWYEPLRVGYKYLLEAGGRLQADGVDFTDLSRLFIDHSEDIYTDECCHYNKHGNHLVGMALGDLICVRLSS